MSENIQPGQRFTLYNGSGTWGHFEGVVMLLVNDQEVHYSIKPKQGGPWTNEMCSTADFQKMIDDGYVEITN